MYLIAVLVALLFVQFWSGKNPLHRDGWVLLWMRWVASWPLVERWRSLHLLVVLAVPTLVVAVALWWLPLGLWFALTILLLLFSLGRGEFARYLPAYTQACGQGDWDACRTLAAQQGAAVDDLSTDDWASLHQRMLQTIAYQGFERLFAVLFWFLAFGGGGALLYRLSAILRTHYPSEGAERWLWLMEWLPVRVLGVSFAVTGNFVGCVNRWKSLVFCTDSSSAWVLRETVLGALSVDDELVQSCDCTQREIAALKRLYMRTLWFWVACLALWTLAYSG